MTRQLISSGSDYEKQAGYSRAVVDGDWIFVSGTTGFDYAAGTIVEDALGQARQAFDNISAALAKAGATLADVVRAEYFITDAKYWDECVPAFGAAFGATRPAATCVVTGLIDPRMKIEIQVTARKSA